MKKTFIAISLLVSSLSLMSVSAQTSASGCTVINGVNVCASTNTGGTGAFGGQIAGVNQNVGGNLLNLIATVQSIVNRLVPLAIGVAVLALFYGIIKFIMSNKEGNEKGHADAIKFMGMAILALFVMVSVWGLVGFLGSIVGVGQGGGVPVPVIPTGPNNG